MRNITIILLVLVLLLSACSAEASVEGKFVEDSNDKFEVESSDDGFSCPKGIHNDPAPGRCPLYTDGDENGFCDYG